MPERRTHVAVAVIHDRDQRILLTRRFSHQHMGGLWEFPGGRVEDDETVEQALFRELKEELGIVPDLFDPLITIEHAYPEKIVVLHVFHVTEFTGTPEGREGQPLVRVRKEELGEFDFPAANKAIVSALLLPDKYAITGSFTDGHELFEKVNGLLAAGFRLIQFRANSLAETDYIQYARELSYICARHDATLMTKGAPDLLEHSWCHGVHLRAKAALELYQDGWQNEMKQPGKKWLAVSCHNLDEIRTAEKIGADFVTLSPVCLTQTHPERVPLGFSLAAEITAQSNIPVYWLGGLCLRNMERVRSAMAQGMAAIRDFWPEEIID